MVFDKMRVGVKTEGEVKQYLALMNKTTRCTFNIQSGRPDRRQTGAQGSAHTTLGPKLEQLLATTNAVHTLYSEQLSIKDDPSCPPLSFI